MVSSVKKIDSLMQKQVDSGVFASLEEAEEAMQGWLRQRAQGRDERGPQAEMTDKPNSEFQWEAMRNADA